jgi:hypothetical protein
MERLAGIKYLKDSNGENRYLRIDLKKYPEKQVIEDLLDGLEAIARKGEPTYPFDEVMRDEFKRRGLKYDV